MKQVKFRRLSIIVFALVIGLHLGEGRTERERASYEGYERVNLRRARSHPEEDGAVPPDALTSSKVDPAVLNDMGSAEIGTGTALVERKRRDRGEVDVHAERAESDAIAAAAESAAAEADAVAAAVEVAEEIEEAGDGNSGGHHSGSSGFGDSAITFEENDDGDNVVVVDQDLREKEHTGGGSADHFRRTSAEAAAGASEFDVRGSNYESHSSSQGQGGWKGDSSINSLPHSGWKGDSSISSSSSGFESSMAQGSVDIGKNYADVQTPLNTLLSESSDLAKEIRLVFQVLARREDYLVQEMEKLRTALQKAIQALEDNNKEAKLIRKRRDNDDSNPYKACVYINPPAGGAAQDNKATPPQALVQPRSDTDYDQPPTSSGGGDEVDLSSVYWLKLPENEDEGILERVHSVLTGVRDAGKDVLLIPVTKTYMSNEDVAKGFLKAVRINPAYTTSTDSKQTTRRRRKKLRLRIRRI